MNSVIAYKQFSLGEGLAELFAPEIKNLNAFKASIAASAKNFHNMFGGGYEKYETGHDKYEQSGSGYNEGYDKSSK